MTGMSRIKTNQKIKCTGRCALDVELEHYSNSFLLLKFEAQRFYNLFSIYVHRYVHSSCHKVIT